MNEQRINCQQAGEWLGGCHKLSVPRSLRARSGLILPARASVLSPKRRQAWSQDLDEADHAAVATRKHAAIFERKLGGSAESKAASEEDAAESSQCTTTGTPTSAQFQNQLASASCIPTQPWLWGTPKRLAGSQ